jgi:hypothetical protein
MAETMFVLLMLIGGLSLAFGILAFLADLIIPRRDPVRERIEAIKAMHPQATYKKDRP